jgi:hypothetical protein
VGEEPAGVSSLPFAILFIDMGGLVVDIYIEFFFRTIANLIRRIGTIEWPVRTAIVTNSEKRPYPGLGCTVIVIHYKYRNAEMRWEGTHNEPFLFGNYAEAYLNRYPGGSEFPVRINPKDHSQSIPANRKIIFTRVK